MARPLALITGGTSGIGQAISYALIAQYDLALVYRENKARAEESRRQLLEENPRAKIFVAQAHLAGFEGCRSALEAVREGAGAEPEIFVHSSGRLGPLFFLGSEFSQSYDMLSEHLVAAMAMCHLVLPDMYQKRRGKIIFIGSLAAREPAEGQASYAAAKGGLESFTRALHREVFHRGVTVNCVAPGMINTPSSAQTIGALRLKHNGFEAGRPEDVARVVRFLCSAEASAISGETHSVKVAESE